MNDDELPRASLDRLGDAFGNLYKAVTSALEEALLSIIDFLKGIT